MIQPLLYLRLILSHLFFGFALVFIFPWTHAEFLSKTTAKIPGIAYANHVGYLTEIVFARFNQLCSTLNTDFF